MLDFSKFTQEKTAIVPIVESSFQYNRKKYSVRPTDDGWYSVFLKGNNAEVDSKYYGPFENGFEIVRGYVYNDMLIFQNFDVGKRKLSKEIQCGFFLNESQTFSSVKCCLWEDGRLYYLEPDYSDTQIYDVKSKYDSEQSLENEKGITPELRTLCLFHDLERQRLKIIQELFEQKQREAENALKQQKEREEFLKSIPGRLTVTFKNAGATLLRYSKQKYRGRDCLIVRWELDSSGREFDSVIDAETFRTVEAGYCMSGDDEKHSLSSMILTAKNYEDQGLIYITRR